jgi:hypothetical protein
MRALQRAIAEQLQLPPEVMQMFNRQDEEDDFSMGWTKDPASEYHKFNGRCIDA